MFKRFLIILASVLLMAGCAAKTPQDQNADLDKPGQQVGTDLPVGDQGQTGPGVGQGNETAQSASLGNIHLGDPFSQAEKILGKDYQETFYDEPGHFPEAWYSREYKQGIRLIVGKDSGKVLEIDAIAADFATNLGAKVGDTAERIKDVYADKYKPFESRHGEGPLEGFYLLEDGQLMIFDYNREDNQLVNTNVKPDSKVEMIRLTQSQYLD